MTDVPAWRSTGVTPFTDFQPGVGAVEGFNVGFTTDTGITGQVFVPTTQIQNTEEIAEKIAQKVSALHALSQLSG